MTYVLHLNDLAKMSPEERDRALDDLVERATRENPEERTALETRIHRFESDTGMSSEEMLRRLTSGAMHESTELSEWLFLLNTRRTLRVAR
jgi:hypothetical protein